jgi:hypothetical protein
MAVVLAAPLLVAGCSRGVPVLPPDPAPEGAAAYACADLKSRYPALVAGHATTATTPTSSNVSAWGDPAIIARCGVPVPAALTPTSQLITINGVDWLPEQLERGYLFTTVGRSPAVEVTVPDVYAPESDALVDLTSAVSTLPLTSASPSPTTS